MSFLHLVATQGVRTDGPLRLCRLPSRTEVAVPNTATHMPEAHASTPASDRSEDSVVSPLEQQLATMEKLARQHYPDDEAGRNAYLVGLLKSRLREYAAKFIQLEVRNVGR